MSSMRERTSVISGGLSVSKRVRTNCVWGLTFPRAGGAASSWKTSVFEPGIGEGRADRIRVRVLVADDDEWLNLARHHFPFCF